MDLIEAAVEAQRLVDAAALSSEFRVPAFEVLLKHLIGHRDGATHKSPPSRAAESASPSAGTDFQEEDILGRIAMKLGLPLEKVQQVYFVDGGDLALSVPSTALSSAKKEATRQIALLLAVGRAAAQIDESGWTPAGAIRKMCDHYGKFDVGNFGKTLKAMDDVFQIRGAGASRQVRANVPGFERAIGLIDEVTRS